MEFSSSMASVGRNVPLYKVPWKNSNSYININVLCMKVHQSYDGGLLEVVLQDSPGFRGKKAGLVYLKPPSAQNEGFQSAHAATLEW